MRLKGYDFLALDMALCSFHFKVEPEIIQGTLKYWTDTLM